MSEQAVSGRQPVMLRCVWHQRVRGLVRTLRALLLDERAGSDKAMEYERAAVEAIELLEEAGGRS